MQFEHNAKDATTNNNHFDFYIHTYTRKNASIDDLNIQVSQTTTNGKGKSQYYFNSGFSFDSSEKMTGSYSLKFNNWVNTFLEKREDNFSTSDFSVGFYVRMSSSNSNNGTPFS